MRKRRRRFINEETAAPWLTLAVILGLWWAGAYLLGGQAEPVPAGVTTVGRAPGAPGAPGAEGAADAGAAGGTGRTGSTAATDAAAAAGAPDAWGLPGRSAGGAEAWPMVPVAGIEASSLRSMFDEVRGGGTRRHEALDILAPRGTPVVAAVSGRIAKLFSSAAGGLTIYQFDLDERFCYYYAHLEAYAPNLNEGETVHRGQIIGYVGTTGNAPPDTPHLHFAVYRLGANKNWWEGEPIDPFGILR